MLVTMVMKSKKMITLLHREAKAPSPRDPSPRDPSPRDPAAMTLSMLVTMVMVMMITLPPSKVMMRLRKAKERAASQDGLLNRLSVLATCFI
jgi:formate hydrogenlyase subunit 3/multisubunit Na+/H+ antiporter MnhD subunit